MEVLLLKLPLIEVYPIIPLLNLREIPELLKVERKLEETCSTVFRSFLSPLAVQHTLTMLNRFKILLVALRVRLSRTLMA